MRGTPLYCPLPINLDNSVSQPPSQVTDYKYILGNHLVLTFIINVFVALTLNKMFLKPVGISFINNELQSYLDIKLTYFAGK